MNWVLDTRTREVLLESFEFAQILSILVRVLVDLYLRNVLRNIRYEAGKP